MENLTIFPETPEIHPWYKYCKAYCDLAVASLTPINKGFIRKRVDLRLLT